ncbi:MAG: TatA/E family twin arginine-targeting protein translocase [Cyanobacterium sp. T60_A2020_053]|nr:TatA/E family twin arginine-targeting protein translocase [Cyanobacterium sp. T60_A2020_053]
MNVFGIGLPEMAVIFVVALLVFGPKKLPEIGRTVGKTLKGFQEASREFQEEFKKEAQQLEESVSMKAQIEAPPQLEKVSNANNNNVSKEDNNENFNDNN